MKYWIQNRFLKSNRIENEKEVDVEIDKIEKCFSSNDLLDFIKKYENLLSTKKSNKYFSTLGINFKNGSVDSVKFYAHILDELADEEILQFIPILSDYKKFLQIKDNGTFEIPKSVGTIFEIKFKLTSDKPTYGFFYLLKNTEDSYNEVGYPAKLPQKVIDEGVSLGINFEYNEDKIFFKRYYYYNKLNEKLFFEKKFKIPLLGEYIEYAEGDNVSKVNTYSGILNNFWKEDRNFSKKEQKIIKQISDKYNLSIMSYGKYENHSIKSIYFREGDSKTSNLENLIQEHSNVFTCLKKT